MKLCAADKKKNYSKLGLSNIKGNLLFAQPCAAYNIKKGCEIYSDRPMHCRGFSCALLKSFRKGERNHVEALGIVERAKKLRRELINKARKTGEFSDWQLDNFQYTSNHIRDKLSAKESIKKYSELHLEYCFLLYFLSIHFHERINKPGE